MSKLALIALLLGACVADDATTTTDPAAPRADAKSDAADESTAVAIVAGEGEFDTDRGDLVVITGFQYPGQPPTTDFIDLSNTSFGDRTPQVREFCALADQLPGTDVCSYLCRTQDVVARLFGSNTGDCTEMQCELPGGVSVQTQVCVSG